eukprot:CAMPEP_0118831360 /NCGR_PEP_ID=MMETSP1162-20130426/30601_1 /TAXON_ID=33656 /ORGANISM="Phaeocystis Sp, Strain CCMP2710" /LENGTH=138 /DNA_ID=CAMNT_0006762775 /DNA_START=61 /DNA_END=477 /DNA_ORIENTATION=+
MSICLASFADLLGAVPFDQRPHLGLVPPPLAAHLRLRLEDLEGGHRGYPEQRPQPTHLVGVELGEHTRLCRVLLAHLGVHRRRGLARRAPSRVGVDDDDLACRIRLAQHVVPLVHALQADDVAAKVRPRLPRFPLLVD